MKCGETGDDVGDAGDRAHFGNGKRNVSSPRCRFLEQDRRLLRLNEERGMKVADHGPKGDLEYAEEEGLKR
jgi:hypothetical protein